MTVLKVNNMTKTYQGKWGAQKVTAIDNISFSVEEGEYIAIMGESGSGKTTLLNSLATIDRPTSGTIFLKDKNMTAIKQGELAKFRREHLGFVFQSFNLLDSLTVEENICLPLVLAGENLSLINERVSQLTTRLGIKDLLKKYPYQISGGQAQRVAVARALVTEPELILADEPTGALDSKNADALLDIFKDLNEKGQTIVMVTHSISAAAHASRVLFIKDGKIFNQVYRGESSNDSMYRKISDTLTVIQTGGGVYEVG